MSTSPTLVVNLWPSAWSIYINFAKRWPWIFDLPPPSIGGWHMEHLCQLCQRWSRILHFPPLIIAGWHKENVHQLRQDLSWILDLPPRGYISTSPTLVVNFWPAASNHRRMTYWGSISTSLSLVANFWPPAGRIYINFANVSCKILACRRQATTHHTRRMYINYANVGREFLTCRLQSSADDTLRLYINCPIIGCKFLTCRQENLYQLRQYCS